jgi:photosystem II stability/assembly factor-like uncharacterized protein
MKRCLIFYLIWIVYVIPNQAQEWVNICPYFEPPSGEYRNLGTFVDSKEGWMVFWGQNKLYHTTNGGTSWSVQMEGYNTYFYDIWFVDNMNGWAKVYKATPFRNSNLSPLLRTTDGGDTWREVSNPPDSAFYAITFIDSLTGFSGGVNAIYCTKNGGETWQAQIIDRGVEEILSGDTVRYDASFGIVDIFFIDKQYGWAVGDRSDITDCGIILNTVNSGKTWDVLAPQTQVLYSVYFSDRMHGCAVGPNLWYGGVILLTEDGGETWREYSPGIPWLNDVVLMDDSTGWVVGDHGYIGYTADGGQSWEPIESGTNADLHRIVFVDNGTVGYIFGENNTLLKYDRTNNAIKEDDSIVPCQYKLFQNYPNPFNALTTIEYTIETTADVMLCVYDLTGKEVIILQRGEIGPGSHHVVWSGKDKYGNEVSSGIYFYVLRIGTFRQVRKMMILY